MTKKKKPAKKKTPAKRKARRAFEGRQAMIPGVKPRKPGAARTYKVQGADGVREVRMPAEPVGMVQGLYRRRPRRPVSVAGAHTYSARMELRIAPDQAMAWDRTAAAAQLTRAEWIRRVCDAAVGAK